MCKLVVTEKGSYSGVEFVCDYAQAIELLDMMMATSNSKNYEYKIFVITEDDGNEE